MATFNKFNQFVDDLVSKVHDFETDTFKIMLTLVAPVATNSVKADLTEIAAGDGYTAGGNTCANPTTTLTTGTVKAVMDDPTTWTAAAGTFPNFRYAVLYNDTPTSPADPLIGWWDYGSTVDLGAAETFTVDLDGTNGVFTVV
jgi:hypothetical protein